MPPCVRARVGYFLGHARIGFIVRGSGVGRSGGGHAHDRRAAVFAGNGCRAVGVLSYGAIHPVFAVTAVFPVFTGLARVACSAGGPGGPAEPVVAVVNYGGGSIGAANGLAAVAVVCDRA